MHYQDQEELPGGSVGPATTEETKEVRSWVRPGSAEDAADRELERTALRWHGNGWYIVTSAPAKRKVTRRDGPFQNLMDGNGRTSAEDRLVRTRTGREDVNWEDLETADREPIDRIIQEGLTERIHAAARAWIAQIGQARAGRAIAGAFVGSDAQFDEVLAGNGASKPDPGFEKLREAMATHEQWRNG